MLRDHANLERKFLIYDKEGSLFRDWKCICIVKKCLWNGKEKSFPTGLCVKR